MSVAGSGTTPTGGGVFWKLPALRNTPESSTVSVASATASLMWLVKQVLALPRMVKLTNEPDVETRRQIGLLLDRENQPSSRRISS
jgi:hypothetical protein